MSPLRLNVAALRKAKGWTQDELAEKANVSRVTIVRIENEEDPPKRVDLDVLESLAEALGLDHPGFLILKVKDEPKRKRGR